jgi:AraC-like DNA-binding protein/ligand-binding sensor protein
MQASTPSQDLSGNSTRSDRDLVEHLQKSELYRDYQKAFEEATGLPLVLRAAGSFQTPLQDSRNRNAFCALMASQNRTCAACLELQQRMESQAATKPATLECFAGLSESAVPIRVGERVIAYLQTGQVLLRKPSESRFSRILLSLRQLGVTVEAKPLREAFFGTQVVSRQRNDSAVSLLVIFAQHLSSLTNQLMVREAASESPTVAKARAYISEHLSEEITLSLVARAAAMSAFYFCKVFKKETGLTFTEYLARLRVETVKKMLLNPHMRISEAAYDAGFQSLSQFNRVFRAFVGETPSDYRDALHRRGAEIGEPIRATVAA